MGMVGGLDLHRRQMTFDVVEVESGEEGRGRVWQPERDRFRCWGELPESWIPPEPVLEWRERVRLYVLVSARCGVSASMPSCITSSPGVAITCCATSTPTSCTRHRTEHCSRHGGWHRPPRHQGHPRSAPGTDVPASIRARRPSNTDATALPTTGGHPITIVVADDTNTVEHRGNAGPPTPPRTEPKPIQPSIAAGRAPLTQVTPDARHPAGRRPRLALQFLQGGVGGSRPSAPTELRRLARGAQGRCSNAVRPYEVVAGAVLDGGNTGD